MGLIKSSHAPASLCAFSLADIERQAKAILLRARQRADQLLAATQAQAEKLKEQATAQGLAEGRQAGTAQGFEQGKRDGQQQALNESRAQLQAAMQALSGALAALDAGRADLEASALVEVVELAIAIARRVTKRQALIDPTILAANLREAMKLVVKSADFRVAIHPGQRQTLDAALPHLQMQWPNLEHVQIIEDPSLTPGGCRIVTAQGQIDADLDAQLDRVAAELLPLSATPGNSNQVE